MPQSPDLGALFGAPDTKTFLGLDPCLDFSPQGASAALVGAPCATPYGSVGAYCQGAPAALRRASGQLAANIDRMNFDLGGPTFPPGTRAAVDCGDLDWSESDFAANRDAIREATGKVLAAGAVPVVLGGDDSIPIPMLEALEALGQPVTVLQIDAHIDWRQEHMGERMGLSSTMRRASEMAHVERIIQVGARGVGSGHPDDHADALDWGAQIIPARQFHAEGVAAALAGIPDGAAVVICLDADALDPSIVPGVIGRSPGGLSYYQVLDLVEGVAARGRIVAMDLVEYVPEMDVDGLGALTLSRLLTACLGVIARAEG
ncbi:arginase family protein [Vannielia litorea]|uniref:arginase family protein n=1 Tax=Vannielia litorea TaxID=1217970 RepID=UPI001C96709F|nr:arginase family protein [Vannielia litorea]MBY6154258.1 arginase family protein [Vannielia litorea]